MKLTDNVIKCDRCGVKEHHLTGNYPRGWVVREYCLELPRLYEHVCEPCAIALDVFNQLPYR